MKEKILSLIENKDYKNLKEYLDKINEVDIAELIEGIEDKNEQVRLFRLLPKDMAADIFSNLDLDIQQKLITSLTTKEAGSIIDNLESDDAADLIDEMPSGVVKKILASTTAETRKDINYLLNYPDNSAGSIMNNDFVEFKEYLTVEEALIKLRKEETETEAIDNCFILDGSRKLIGMISLKDLIFNDSKTKLEDIMKDNVISCYTYEDQEEIGFRFSKYDLTIMPVVDREKRLVGVITIDDIVDIIEEEVTEDMEKMAAISPSDKSYMKTGVFETFKKRIPWLLLLMVSATFTGKIITSYEEALASYVVLTAFIPMLMDTGGNAGGQASVTIIRGLSLNEIEFSDIIKIMWKEFRVAILIGITLAMANFLKLMIIDNVSLVIALVVCLTLIITIIISKLVGCTLPMLAKKIGFDPAVMASPFITTIVDAISLIAYFKIATMLLNI